MPDSSASATAPGKAPFTMVAERARRAVWSAVWRCRCALQPELLETFTLSDWAGLRFRYPLSSVIGRELFLDRFEPVELRFMGRVLRPGDVCFDVGANGGIFTLIASRAVGAAGRVHAFEAGARQLRLLRQNLALNGVTNASVFEGAVSAESGTVRFAIAADGAFDSMARTAHPGQVVTGWTEVSAVTLDDYMAEHDVRRVDFLKVDVEGAEKLVFEGASRLLRGQRPLTIAFEASNLNTVGFGYTVEDLFGLLWRHGFQLHYHGADGHLVRFDAMAAGLGDRIYNFVATA